MDATADSVSATMRGQDATPDALRPRRAVDCEETRSDDRISRGPIGVSARIAATSPSTVPTLVELDEPV